MNLDTTVLYEGKLNIRGILKIWSERYVVLEASKRILYYKSLEQCKENKLAGTIQIDDAFVLNADKETKKQYSFKLVHQSADKETRYFQTTSEAEKKAWMNAISTAVFGADVENQPDTSESKKRWLSITGNFKGKDSLLDDWTLIEDPKKKGKQEIKPPQDSEQEKLEKEKKERAQKLNKLPSNVYSRERLEFFYEQYEEPEDQYIGPAGIERLCKDLQVDPEDVSMLIFAWKIGAQKMGFFEVDTLEKLKQKLLELRSDVNDETKFKEIYKWAFTFSKEPTQRALDAELAAALLKVLTKSRVDFPHAGDFIEYLTNHSKFKAVNADAWQSFYHFNKTVSPDLKNYNEEDAWPSMFDDFVEWKRKKEPVANK